MAGYWCLECGLPAAVSPAAEIAEFECWACSGPVASRAQVAYWNNPAFAALLEERVRQPGAGEGVELARFPGVRFAPGAAADYLLLEALGRPDR